jgi:hypothetical protein
MGDTNHVSADTGTTGRMNTNHWLYNYCGLYFQNISKHVDTKFSAHQVRSSHWEAK